MTSDLQAEVERLREEVKTQNGWAHDQLREVERLRAYVESVTTSGLLSQDLRDEGRRLLGA